MIFKKLEKGTVFALRHHTSICNFIVHQYLTCLWTKSLTMFFSILNAFHSISNKSETFLRRRTVGKNVIESIPIVSFT